MRDDGDLVAITRGVYRLSTLPPLSHPDLVTVALRVPHATLCLISALAYHDITTEVPHEVQIALPRGTKSPQIDHPPIRVFRFSSAALTEGVECALLDNVEVRVYGPEKTVADCFKFRNQIGTDVAVEALKLVMARRRAQPATLLRYARICRVERVMMSYLEALQ